MTAQLPAPSEPEEESPGEKRMPFLAHLGELRDCIRNAAIAVVVSTAIAYAFRKYLFALMARGESPAAHLQSPRPAR